MIVEPRRKGLTAEDAEGAEEFLLLFSLAISAYSAVKFLG